MAEKFSGTSRTLHWTVSVLVLMMLYDGATLSRETATWHFGFGIITLVVMVLWLGHRMTHPRPAPLPMPRWQQIASKSVHHLLTLAVTLQPILGLLMVMFSKRDPVAFGVIPLKIVQNDTLYAIGHELHGPNALLIAILVVLHIGGALYHQFILKDGGLTRMLPGKR